MPRKGLFGCGWKRDRVDGGGLLGLPKIPPFGASKQLTPAFGLRNQDVPKQGIPFLNFGRGKHVFGGHSSFGLMVLLPAPLFLVRITRHRQVGEGLSNVRKGNIDKGLTIRGGCLVLIGPVLEKKT